MLFAIDGMKLKSARWDKLGIFPRDLAKRARVSERAIEEIERGLRKHIREATAKALARALKVDVRELERKDSPPPAVAPVAQEQPKPETA